MQYLLRTLASISTFTSDIKSEELDVHHSIVHAIAENPTSIPTGQTDKNLHALLANLLSVFYGGFGRS